jgi:transcriptional regulator with XRE-family HTH domain
VDTPGFKIESCGVRSRPVLKKLGAEIKDRRLARDLSQEELADAAGVNVNTIQRLEGAKIEGKILTLFDVAMALKMSLSDLIAGAERR